MAKKVMIFAGEASGDLQGARLAAALRKYEPDLIFSGVGGPRMKAEGIDILFDSTAFGVIGAVEGILKLPQLIHLFYKAKQGLIDFNPDLAILIDTPAFNMRFAKVCRERGIKTVYYFPPSAWSGSVKRAAEIAGKVDMVVNTFKFTADTYDKGKINHSFFGHPLIDVIEDITGTREDVIKELKLKEGIRYVALLPGSRSQEIRLLLPVLLDSARELHKRIPGLQFLLPIAAPVLKKKIEKLTKNADFPLTVYDGKATKIMSVSELAIMASGSASLEAAVLGVPTILTYKLLWLDWRIIKRFVKLRWCGLPNLMLERDVVPELIQHDASVENICRWAEDLLQNEEKRSKMIKDLNEVKKSLGEPGVTDRVARHIRESLLK
ncbi:MAG: lipid-A-disaccharide synthase [Firmicutes bacterium]|nr:lipid-A-disaccharide synthase [Bacillota bacterium]